MCEIEFSKSPSLERQDYQQHAAHVIEAQLLSNPVLATIGMPVDPDVSETMGAFEEQALTPFDLDDLDEGEQAHG
ncbi:MAG: hypothetical protein LBB60_02985 [Desulfovibrio sp.]|jgi:hypothetical protein|nr:hypothetical protein [Desulfovibrio sp.]